MQSSHLFLSLLSRSLFSLYPIKPKNIACFFLSVSSFGSEIILGEDPEGWVNIFLHIVVIVFCSVIQSCLPRLFAVTSVKTDKTQQQTLIYTGNICWFFSAPLKPELTYTNKMGHWTILFWQCSILFLSYPYIELPCINDIVNPQESA